MFWFWKKRDKATDTLQQKEQDSKIDDKTLEQILDEYNPDAKRLALEYCKHYDSSKKNLLIIDDSVGIVSLVKDAIEELGVAGQYNIISFSSAYAGLAFEYLQRKCPMRIDVAVIDLIFGGVARYRDRTIKIEGVDVFERIYKTNPGVKFLFYTGNSMNKHMPQAKRIMDAFYRLTGEDINRYLLYKAEHPIDALAAFLERLLKE